MTSNALRQEVLKSFKNLHRARCLVFKNDKLALNAARKEINEGYKKNKHVTNPESIEELVKFANEVCYELKTTVVQLEEAGSGKYRIKIRPEMIEEAQNMIAKAQNISLEYSKK